MDEQADQVFTEQLHDQRHEVGEHQHGQQTVLKAHPNPVCFAGPHVLTGIGGQGHTHGVVGLLHQLIQAVGGGKGRHGRGPEGIDHRLQGRSGNGDQTPLKGQRKAQPKRIFQDGRVRGQVSAPEAEIGVCPVSVQKRAEARQHLGKHGGKGCTEHAHAEGADKEDVQPDVEHAGDHQEIQRRAGVAQGSLHGGSVIVNGDQRHGNGRHPHIGDGIRQDLRGRPHPGQHRGHHQEGNQAGQQGRGQGDISGIDDGGAHLLILLGPEILGGHDAAAAADAVKNGKKQERDGPRRPNGRQSVGPEHPADDHGVGQVIGLLKHVADEQRQRKDGQQDQRPSFRHVHGSGMSHEDVLLFRWSKYKMQNQKKVKRFSLPCPGWR